VKVDWNTVTNNSPAWQNNDKIFVKPSNTLSNYTFYIDDIKLSNCMTNKFNAINGELIGQIATVYEFSGGMPGGTITKRWPSYDHIGNVVGRSNENGTQVDTYYQDTYGNIFSNISTGQWSTSYSDRHLTTKEFDSGVDLYYFWHRWYDPSMGRFILKDPVPKIGGDIYCLSRNNPLKFRDASGRQSAPRDFPRDGFDQCAAIFTYIELTNRYYPGPNRRVFDHLPDRDHGFHCFSCCMLTSCGGWGIGDLSAIIAQAIQEGTTRGWDGVVGNIPDSHDDNCACKEGRQAAVRWFAHFRNTRKACIERCGGRSENDPLYLQ
jgi:RHS repeat-associated protein